MPDSLPNFQSVAQSDALPNSQSATHSDVLSNPQPASHSNAQVNRGTSNQSGCKERLWAMSGFANSATPHSGAVSNTLSSLEIPQLREKREKPALSISNLSVYYEDFKALDKVSMEIYPREITAFIGPSGCGKSTLIKTINRMNDLVPDCRVEGSIRLDDDEIYARSMDVNLLRKRVGMVFQKPNPFPMSVYDNVAFGPRTHGIRKKAELDEVVERALRDAVLFDELKDGLKRNALALSGGQQQRLCIARALAVEPEVLLMDEPTSALDPISTARIEELALTLKERYTIVIVTHNMQQALRISDQTAFFLLGELVEYNHTLQLFTNPQDSRTDDYVKGRFG